MILSGTVIGLICVAALLAASLLLAWLDRKERGKGNVDKSRFLSRMALGLFLTAFVGGVVVTLLGGVRPREDRKEGSAMTGKPSIGSVNQEELKALEERVAKDPKDVGARERLGHLYLQLMDFDQVFRLSHEALQIDPKSLEARVHMGMVFFSMGEPDRAVQQFDQVLQSDPENSEALRFKAMVLSAASHPENR
jgi:cytochrome c-type biogenesis protein CcmH/NrfG